MGVPAALSLLVLLAGCGSAGRVGVEPGANARGLPVVVIAWCGADGPAQVDVAGTGVSLHYRAQREFDGGIVRLDLAAPGDDWVLHRGVVEGGRESSMSPFLDYSLLRASAGTVASVGDRPAEADLGRVEFTLRNVSQEGVYVRTEGESGYLSDAEFTADC